MGDGPSNSTTQQSTREHGNINLEGLISILIKDTTSELVNSIGQYRVGTKYIYELVLRDFLKKVKTIEDTYYRELLRKSR